MNSFTVGQLGARFLKEHVAVRCKPTTQSEYRRSVELFIDPFFGQQRVRSVTTADALSFMALCPISPTRRTARLE